MTRRSAVIAAIAALSLVAALAWSTVEVVAALRHGRCADVVAAAAFATGPACAAGYAARWLTRRSGPRV